MKINIHKIKLFGYHGVHENEKKDGQDFEISISIKLDKLKKIKDDINSTVDYTEIIDKTIGIFHSKRYNLMESLLNDILDEILSISDIRSVCVSIKKTNPPVDYKLESIELTEKRKR